MTTRKIVINNCSKCPFVKHKGGFGNPAYVPYCNADTRQTELPYTVSTAPPNERTGNRITTAQVKPGIPDWCPLEID